MCYMTRRQAEKKKLLTATLFDWIPDVVPIEIGLFFALCNCNLPSIQSYTNNLVISVAS